MPSQTTPTQAKEPARTAAHTREDASRALEPGRSPLPPRLPASGDVELASGRRATVKRRAPRAALKAKVALATAIGPTFARLLLGGVDVELADGARKRFEALDLLALATAAGRQAAAADGLDVAQLGAIVRRDLPGVLLGALAELDPDALDPVIEHYLVGAVVVEARGSTPEAPSYVPILDAAQLDELLDSDLDLGRLIVEAVTLGLAPFGVGR